MNDPIISRKDAKVREAYAKKGVMGDLDLRGAGGSLTLSEAGDVHEGWVGFEARDGSFRSCGLLPETARILWMHPDLARDLKEALARHNALVRRFLRVLASEEIPPCQIRIEPHPVTLTETREGYVRVAMEYGG